MRTGRVLDLAHLAQGVVVPALPGVGAIGAGAGHGDGVAVAVRQAAGVSIDRFFPGAPFGGEVVGVGVGGAPAPGVVGANAYGAFGAFGVGNRG